MKGIETFPKDGHKMVTVIVLIAMSCQGFTERKKNLHSPRRGWVQHMNASCNQRDENGVIKIWLLHHNIPHQAVQTLSSLLGVFSDGLMSLDSPHGKSGKITKSISIHFNVAYNLHLYIDCFYLSLSRCWLSVRPSVCLSGRLARFLSLSIDRFPPWLQQLLIKVPALIVCSTSV